MAGHTERDFEDAIERGLVANGGYTRGDPKRFDAATALFPDDVIGFIRDSQSARWSQLEAMLKDRTAATIIVSLRWGPPCRGEVDGDAVLVRTSLRALVAAQHGPCQFDHRSGAPPQVA